MKVSEILKTGVPTLSFEVFPPKKSDTADKIFGAVKEVADMHPDFMSVTCGAGGSMKGYKVELAEAIKQRGVEPIVHMTCVGAEPDNIAVELARLKADGIDNIMALRGDLPEGVENTDGWTFKHGSDIALEVRKNGDFCIGGGCYPEKHPDSKTLDEDIAFMKFKQDCGCDFLTTQMFFDNDTFYRYLYKVRAAGITVPILPGIMPVTSIKQLERFKTFENVLIPKIFTSIAERFGDSPEAFKQACMAVVKEQIVDLLANGVNNIHVYTMNKPEVALEIQESLSELVPSAGRAVAERIAAGK
jgi:methylenetetrahydrofolate reductase (NADPH)